MFSLTVLIIMFLRINTCFCLSVDQEFCKFAYNADQSKTISSCSPKSVRKDYDTYDGDPLEKFYDSNSSQSPLLCMITEEDVFVMHHKHHDVRSHYNRLFKEQYRTCSSLQLSDDVLINLCDNTVEYNLLSDDKTMVFPNRLGKLVLL